MGTIGTEHQRLRREGAAVRPGLNAGARRETMMELAPPLAAKYAHLTQILKPMQRVAVAFSGGVDSTTLLSAACETLGSSGVLALLSVAPSVPRREVAQARALADSLHVRLVSLQTNELKQPAYAANDENRCYFCKNTLFHDCLRVAQAQGIAHVLYGAILDDLGDRRPGMRAARELGIRGPLAEAQFTKEDVRQLARAWKLPVAEKPASACLASRIASGIRVTVDNLSQVERAEDFLHDLGFRQVRVRHHADDTARIEVDPAEIPQVAARAAEITAFLEGVGYRYVSLDLRGYRSGVVPANDNLATARQT